MTESVAGNTERSLWNSTQKLLTAIAVLSLTLSLVFAVGLIGGLFQSPWVLRVLLGGAAAAYAVYVYQVTHPRLPLVTEEDDHTTCVRLRECVSRVCRQARIPMPRLGIVMKPEVGVQTIGLTPKSAYVLPTKGLLDLIVEEKELDALIAREVYHIVHFDCAMATCLAGVTQTIQGVAEFCQGAAAVKDKSASKLDQFITQLKEGGLATLCGVLFVFVVAVYLAYATFFVATSAVVAMILLSVGILSTSAVLRRRELMADRYAGQLVGAEPLASALLRLARADPGERERLACRVEIGAESETALEAREVLEYVRSQQTPANLVDQIASSVLPHPFVVQRLGQLAESDLQGDSLSRLIAPVARAVESRASWLTDDHRARAVRPLEREGTVWIMGAVSGIVFGVLAAVLPAGNPLAGLTVGLSGGLALGMLVVSALQRNGPFLGADVIDASVTGFTAWFVVAVGLSTILFLPAAGLLLQWSWMVAVVTVVVCICGYVLLAPVLQPAGDPDAIGLQRSGTVETLETQGLILETGQGEPMPATEPQPAVSPEMDHAVDPVTSGETAQLCTDDEEPLLIIVDEEDGEADGGIPVSEPSLQYEGDEGLDNARARPNDTPAIPSSAVASADQDEASVGGECASPQDQAPTDDADAMKDSEGLFGFLDEEGGESSTPNEEK